MADWANFFAAEIGASATLTGLVAVAISINLPRILAHAKLPGRAAEALILLAAVLLVTSLGLVPGQPRRVFGVEVLAVGLAAFLAPLTLQLRARHDRTGVSALKQILRMAISAAASLPFIVAGATLIAGADGALYWLAAGVILSLAAGIFAAWVLLVEILR
jgi:modulator of FtsH protease